jgi:hypothetical protein
MRLRTDSVFPRLAECAQSQISSIRRLKNWIRNKQSRCETGVYSLIFEVSSLSRSLPSWKTS